jgi:hypothetical protein
MQTELGRIAAASTLAPESRSPADAEALLQRAVFLSVFDGCPNEEDAEDDHRNDDQDNGDDYGEELHSRYYRLGGLEAASHRAVPPRGRGRG